MDENEGHDDRKKGLNEQISIHKKKSLTEQKKKSCKPKLSVGRPKKNVSDELMAKKNGKKSKSGRKPLDGVAKTHRRHSRVSYAWTTFGIELLPMEELAQAKKRTGIYTTLAQRGMPPPPPYKAKAEVADQGYAAAANMPVTGAAAPTPKKLKVVNYYHKLKEASRLKRASASQSVASTSASTSKSRASASQSVASTSASTSKSAQKSKYILVILSFNNRNLKLIDLTLL